MTEPLTPPTRAAALGALAAVRPDDYARTRNAIEGAVTGLSPWITHGLLSLPEVLAGVLAQRAQQGRPGLHVQHKLVFELGWREYWRHVWAHRGEAILQSLHQGLLPEAAYAPAVPTDVMRARCGVPAIDQAVQQLTTTGRLHNHARMWLASYLVHLRRVHWRAGADWMFGHLLDGDLASNHLSWQWVAATGSRKPYLFNAENVARYAPPAWHSPGTVIDTSYEALDALARAPQGLFDAGFQDTPSGIDPRLLDAPPSALGLQAPDPAWVAGHEVWLVHPWALGDLPAGLPPGTRVLGVMLKGFHQRWPWALHRWQFVGERLAALAPQQRWWGTADEIRVALTGALRVCTVDDPHLDPVLAGAVERVAPPMLFEPVDRRCDSFSQWWTRVSRGREDARDLLPAVWRDGMPPDLSEQVPRQEDLPW